MNFEIISHERTHTKVRYRSEERCHGETGLARDSGQSSPREQALKSQMSRMNGPRSLPGFFGFSIRPKYMRCSEFISKAQTQRSSAKDPVPSVPLGCWPPCSPSPSHRLRRPPGRVVGHTQRSRSRFCLLSFTPALPQTKV